MFLLVGGGASQRGHVITDQRCTLPVTPYPDFRGRTQGATPEVWPALPARRRPRSHPRCEPPFPTQGLIEGLDLVSSRRMPATPSPSNLLIRNFLSVGHPVPGGSSVKLASAGCWSRVNPAGPVGSLVRQVNPRPEGSRHHQPGLVGGGPDLICRAGLHLGPEGETKAFRQWGSAEGAFSGHE